MIESEVLAGLLHVPAYRTQVGPYLKEEYFTDPSWAVLYRLIQTHYEKYEKAPSRRELAVALGKLTDVLPVVFDQAVEHLTELKARDDVDYKWLVDETESFCKDKALYIAMRNALQIIEDEKKGGLTRGAIPDMVRDALGISFDTRIGHDYFADAEARWEFFHNPVNKIKFSLDMLNKITKGGVSRKTLTVFVAGTNVGKSHLMCHLAADHLLDGLNVLYITLEMGEEFIAQRIDMNLLDLTDEDLIGKTKEEFLGGVRSLQNKTAGKLVVREYPNGTANANHIRALMSELELKQGFVPDVVYVDYLGIMASHRLDRSRTGMYEYYKSIAEELRALASMTNIALITAVQTNRSGFEDADFGLTGTAESFGIPYTADLMLAVIETPELVQMRQLMFKQLKNRYGQKVPEKFMVGADRTKQKFYDLDNSSVSDSRVEQAKNVSASAKPKFKGTLSQQAVADVSQRRADLDSFLGRKPKNFKSFT